ncbi:putative non-specific serine/threonine protein kinase [Helianthus anomalus]
MDRFCSFWEEERMIVMEYVVNESLDKYLSDSTTLWSQRLYMCFRTACGLCYWEAENRESYCAKNFKVLLNKDKEAKLLICIDSLSDAKKSQIYTLGVFLLEVLYGKKATTKDVRHRRYLLEYRVTIHFVTNAWRKENFIRFWNEAFKIQWKHENPVSTFTKLHFQLLSN